MSKLEELIRELCPDGVEYKKLNTVCKIYDGTHSTPQYKNAGVKFVSVQNINALYETDKYISEEDFKKFKITPRIGDVFMTRIGSIGVCAVVDRDEPLAYYVSLALLRPDTEVLNSGYLKYIIESTYGRKELRKRTLVNAVPIKINKDDIGKIQIPIPPLPVQREIIRILDNFAELTAELQEKLTAELTARKKQYEYYLDQFYGGTYEEMLLLEKRTGWKILPLSGIGTFTRGKRFVKADSEGLEDGVPCIHYGELYTYYGVSAEKSKSFVPVELAQKLRYAHKGDVVIVGAGENNIDIGVGVAWFGEDVVVHDACYIFKHKLNPKYLSYFLRTTIYHNQIKKYVSEGKICSISAQGLGKAIIPVPPMEEQKRIVSILDRFDTFCNDLTSGLPAEIEARQKQYEYYRDKLLDFPEYTK